MLRFINAGPDSRQSMHAEQIETPASQFVIIKRSLFCFNESPEVGWLVILYREAFVIQHWSCNWWSHARCVSSHGTCCSLWLTIISFSFRTSLYRERISTTSAKLRISVKNANLIPGNAVMATGELLPTPKMQTAARVYVGCSHTLIGGLVVQSIVLFHPYSLWL